jgi:RNA polymerase sigma-70 factor (ECF subfamily)
MTNVSQMAILGNQFSEFQTRLMNMVERRIDPRLRRRISADDVVQDAYVHAHTRWTNSKGTEPVESYVWWYCITRDVLIEAWRKHTRGMRDLNRDIALPSRSSILICTQLQAQQESPSALVQEAERKESLHQALEQLRPEEQEILWMRHFDKLSHREISEVMKISERASIARYTRALKKLRQIMPPNESE